MNLLNYQQIVWDWNGTLLNDVQLCADIMNNLLRKRSMPELSLNKYRKIFTFPVKDYYIKAGHDFTNESFAVIGKEFMDEYERRKYECKLFDSALNVLRLFKSVKINQYLLSAYKQESLNIIVKYFNIEEYFKEIYGLNHIYADEKLQLGRKLDHEINTDGKQNILMIGDTLHDYDVASELGWDCLLISSGHQHKSVLKKTDVDIINNLNELYKILIEEKVTG